MEAIGSKITYKEEGLYFAPANIFLDPQLPVENAVISHAHADHFIQGHKNVFCTPLTALLIKQRIKNYSGKINEINYHSTFQLNDCSITFFPAGHILGSAQILLEYNNIRYNYTGDYKLEQDSTCEPFELVPCDVLITESTFASQELKHPEVINEISKLNNTENINVILGVYALGKAQRITHLINKHCPGKTIMVHPRIVSFHKAYEKAGIQLGNWQPYNRHLFRRSVDCIYLLPPAFAKNFTFNHTYLRSFATGWNHLQDGFDLRITISDHADWFDLLQVIKQSNAKEVFTLHGNGDDLKKYFSDTEISVTPLH